MFEKRPIWGLIVGLNVCVLIWLISVQQPIMFDASTAAISSSNNYGAGGRGAAVGGGVGRDLLSKHVNSQSNEYNDEQAVAAAVSTLTTLTYNSSSSNNNSNNLTIIPQTSNLQNKIDTKFKISPTATTSQASLEHASVDISLTSSLGTGVLNIQNKPTPSWIKLTAVSSALPDEDFTQLIDLHNFQYLMPQPVCSQHIEALILIHSAPRNYEKRQLIRETWGSIGHHTTNNPLRVLFLLGAVESQQLQEELKTENSHYRDIIQGSFVDDYRNMTYKHIMAFKWFLYNCPQSQILVKVDDDVYVNTPQLIKYLKQQQQQQQEQLQQYQIIHNNNNNNINPTITTSTTTMKTPNSNNNMTTITKTTTTTKNSIFQSLNIFAKFLTPTSFTTTSSSSSATFSNQSSSFNASLHLFQHPHNLLFCQKIIGSLVKRSYRSKWRVSFKEYSERYYPPYCPGYAIIYSPDIIFRLYRAAQNSKYFWIDDVHITGVLAQQTNTTITTSSHYVLYSDECDKLLSGKTDLSEMEFLFAWHSITSQKIKALWHLQMMSLKNLDDLHYKVQNDNERLAYVPLSSSSASSSSSSSLSYTSTDGLS